MTDGEVAAPHLAGARYDFIIIGSGFGGSVSALRLRAQKVILAAGAIGSVDLLLACKEKGFLPNLSAAVGQHTRTNSEIICGARSRTAEVDHSQGIAIASDVQADAETHIQIVRYPAGSGLMGLLGTLAAPGGGRIPRALR